MKTSYLYNIFIKCLIMFQLFVVNRSSRKGEHKKTLYLKSAFLRYCNSLLKTVLHFVLSQHGDVFFIQLPYVELRPTT